MKRLFPLILALVLAAVFMTGCGPAYVAVGTRPEPPVYAWPLPPVPNYVWIEGEWVWSGGVYVYRRGYWALPGPATIIIFPDIGNKEGRDGYRFPDVGAET